MTEPLPPATPPPSPPPDPPKPVLAPSRPAPQSFTCVVTVDWTDANGALKQRVVWGYDSGGNARIGEFDADADGIVDERFFYTYDGAGKRLTVEIDSAAGGLPAVVVRRTDYAYDGAGRLLTSETDMGANGSDGIMDFRLAYTYDGDGNLLTRRLYQPPDAFDDVGGATFTYGGDGNRQTCEWGFATSAARETYTSDAAGNRLTVENEFLVDGTIGRITMSYDVDGHLLTEELDSGMRTTWTYGADGNVLTAEAVFGSNGTVVERTTWVYDCSSPPGRTLRAPRGANGYLSENAEFLFCPDNPARPPG